MIEIDTPRAAFTVDRPGYYRVDVERHERRSARPARAHGSPWSRRAERRDGAGRDQRVLAARHRRHRRDARWRRLDDWDRWNDERTASFAEAPRSAQYVSREVAGVDDLDRYGDWHEEPRYGRVWGPRDVGRRLVAVQHRPLGLRSVLRVDVGRRRAVGLGAVSLRPVGPRRRTGAGRRDRSSSRPAYAPALVAFFGAPGVSVSVSVGAPFVSWCPLGVGRARHPVVGWRGLRRSSVLGWLGRPARRQQRRRPPDTRSTCATSTATRT